MGKERNKKKEASKEGRKDGEKERERERKQKKDSEMKGHNKENTNNIELLMTHTTMKTLFFMHLNPKI